MSELEMWTSPEDTAEMCCMFVAEKRKNARLEARIAELEDAIGKVAHELSTSKHHIWPGTAHRMARDIRAALREGMLDD